MSGDEKMPDDPQIVGLVFVPAVLRVKRKRQAEIGDFKRSVGKVFDRDGPEKGVGDFKGGFDSDLASRLVCLFFPGLTPEFLLVSFDAPFVETGRVARCLFNFETQAGRRDGFKSQAVETVEGSGVRRSIFYREIVAAGVAVEETPADGNFVGTIKSRIIQPVNFDGRGCGRLRKIILDPFDGPLFRVKRKIAARATFRIHDGQVVV